MNEVSFYVVSAGGENDSVDINIRELDKWSIIPVGSVSRSGYNVGLTDKNFLGTDMNLKIISEEIILTGLIISVQIISSQTSGTLMFRQICTMKLTDTNISTGILAVDRPFFSPVAKWAAGISLASRFKKDSLEYSDTAYIPLNLKFSTQDFWAGKAKQIFKNNTDKDYITNLILAVRYLRIRYSEKPSELI